MKRCSEIGFTSCFCLLLCILILFVTIFLLGAYILLPVRQHFSLSPFYLDQSRFDLSCMCVCLCSPSMLESTEHAHCRHTALCLRRSNVL